MYFLQLIRWKNLVMIILIQSLLRYYLFPLFTIPVSLSDFQFALLVTATVLITAGGYIINDIFDVEVDKINKPKKQLVSVKISKEKAHTLYIILTVLGVLIAFYLVYIVNHYYALLYFVIPALLLYIYAAYLKKKLLVGNIVVSLLIAFSFFILLFFEKEALHNFHLLGIVNVIALFAFLLNLAREIIKDAEDITGDKANGVISVATKYGFKGVNKWVSIIISALIGVSIALIYNLYKTQIALAVYFTVAILMSLLVFLSQLNKAKKAADYEKLSIQLKLIMLVGILSILFILP